VFERDAHKRPRSSHSAEAAEPPVLGASQMKFLLAVKLFQKKGTLLIARAVTPSKLPKVLLSCTGHRMREASSFDFPMKVLNLITKRSDRAGQRVLVIFSKVV
jgi:hypothetical protein